MDFHLERESVCLGDDVDAPHAFTLNLPEWISVSGLLRGVWLAGYLPRIQGGKATWVVIGTSPVAVMAQEWWRPKMLVASGSRARDVCHHRQRTFVFKYAAQRDPNEIYEILAADPTRRPWSLFSKD